MPTAIINNQPVELEGRGAAELHPGGAADRLRDSLLLLAPGAVGRGQLPHVPGRGRRQEAGRHRRDAAEARPRLPDAGQGRHGRHRRQRKGEGGPEGDARIPAAEPSARLPDLRSGGRVLAAGLQLQVRPRLQPAARAEEHQAGQGPHRRADHAVHRPLHHVHPLRPVHPRDQRHGGAAGRSAAARTKRSTSSPATRATTSSPATSSTSARSAPCAARTSCTSSASGG